MLLLIWDKELHRQGTRWFSYEEQCLDQGDRVGVTKSSYGMWWYSRERIRRREQSSDVLNFLSEKMEEVFTDIRIYNGSCRKGWVHDGVNCVKQNFRSIGMPVNDVNNDEKYLALASGRFGRRQ